MRRRFALVAARHPAAVVAVVIATAIVTATLIGDTAQMAHGNHLGIDQGLIEPQDGGAYGGPQEIDDD